jgi:hypothetical protein
MALRGSAWAAVLVVSIAVGIAAIVINPSWFV